MLLNNYQQILSLPIYAGLTDDDVNYVCDQVNWSCIYLDIILFETKLHLWIERVSLLSK